MSCPHRFSDGAYVLGALSPAERAAFEVHLAGCAECTAAVRQLAPLPGLLRRVAPQALGGGAPEARVAGAPEALRGGAPGAAAATLRLPELLATMTRIRRQRVHRWRVAAAALVLAAVAGGAAAVTAAVTTGPGPGDPPVAVPMSPMVTQAPVSAQVRLSGAAGGTTVWLACTYPTYDDEHANDQQGPQLFQLVAVAGDGAEEQLGSWWAGPGDRVELTSLTRFTGAELSRIELRDARGTVLLTHQP